MTRIAYVNGRFTTADAAQVAMEDRGYQFADGVYEVIALYEGRLLDGDGHLARLERSLRELNIPMPMSRRALDLLIKELLRRSRKRNGLIYMQVTSGAATRNHLAKPKKPVFSMSLNPAKYPDEATLENGVKVITHPDERWARCDIKSIGLLPNVIARKKAQSEGAREAWLVNREGYVTEGSLSNAYIVKGGCIYTHPIGTQILGGITRDTILRLAREAGLQVREEAFTLEQALQADEAFATGASSFVLPITQIDDKRIGNGKAGETACKLIKLYDDFILTQPKASL